MEVKVQTIGEQLKEYRARNGLTQRELGGLLDMKQTDISLIENGRKKAPPELEAAFDLYAKKNAGLMAPPSSIGKAVEVLLSEMTAARQEMGRPIEPEEREALNRSTYAELLSQSGLLREAMEVKASRELLAGAKEFRKKREAARNGGGRKC